MADGWHLIVKWHQMALRQLLRQNGKTEMRDELHTWSFPLVMTRLLGVSNIIEIQDKVVMTIITQSRYVTRLSSLLQPQRHMWQLNRDSKNTNNEGQTSDWRYLQTTLWVKNMHIMFIHDLTNHNSLWTGNQNTPNLEGAQWMMMMKREKCEQTGFKSIWTKHHETHGQRHKVHCSPSEQWMMMIAMMKRDQEKEKKHHEIRQSITSVKFSQSFMLVLLHDNLNCPSCSSHFRSGHAPLSCASYWQHHTPLSTAITPLSSRTSHTFWFSRCYKLTSYLLTY